MKNKKNEKHHNHSSATNLLLKKTKFNHRSLLGMRMKYQSSSRHIEKEVLQAPNPYGCKRSIT